MRSLLLKKTAFPFINKGQRNLLIAAMLVIAIVVVGYSVIPTGPNLPPGILGQRCLWVTEQGYELSETTYQQYLDYVGDMQYDYTEYQDPADWTTFSTRLQAAMDTVPEHVNIYFVYDESLVHGEILYFRLDTSQVHELVSYWVD